MDLNTNKLRILISLAVTGLFSSIACATQADLDKEIADYAATFKSGSFAEQRKVIEKLTWAGHSSPKLFDVVESRLIETQNASDKAGKESAAWYAKTLGLSGNPKYRATLEQVAANADAKKVRKNAELGLERLNSYTSWNPVLAASLVSAPAGKLEEQRVQNMLSARDYDLVRIGAKRVYYAHISDQELVTKARQRLEQEWPNCDGSNFEQEDAVAWLIRVMAESGNAENKPLLEKIENEGKSKKVRKYAKKYRKYL